MLFRQKKSKKVIKITAIVLVIVVGILALMFNSGITALKTVSGYVVVPVVEAVGSAFTGIGNFFASFTSRMQLQDKLASAEEKLAQLETVRSVADEVKMENERLLELLNEKSNYPSMEFVYAQVIMRSIDDYSAVFTLNKGTDDGIKKNMTVIAAGGLAGKVVEASSNSCILLAIIDSRCSVPALSFVSRDTGIVKGVSKSGSTAGYCTVEELPTNALLYPGDEIITSGMGEVYPKGIKIGKITEVSQGNLSSFNSSAKLTPYVDFDHLENVLIITSAGE